MSLDWARLVPALVFAALLLIAAASDIRSRRIPNWTVLALIAVFMAAGIFGVAPQRWLPSLAAFAIALAGSVGLYLLGAFGAGDSKLFSATALFLGVGNLLLLTCATAIAGGVLAIGFLIFRPKSALRGLSAWGRAEAGDTGIPYGVAIAIGGLATAVYARVLWPHYHFTHYDPRAL